MGKKNTWQNLVLILTLCLTMAPQAISYAQSAPVSAQQVCGKLPFQYTKHYLELHPVDASSDMEVVMTYYPNDDQILRSASGFVIFNASQLEAAISRGGNLYHPELANSGVGSDEIGDDEINVKRATLPALPLNIVIINDSTSPLDYCLSGGNVTYIDQSGEQVRAASQPTGTTSAPSPPGATQASTPLPAPTATPATPSSGVRMTTLTGLLAEPYQVHLYPVEVTDTTQGVTLRLSDLDNAGVDLILFPEDGVQAWIRSGLVPTSPELTGTIVAGPDPSLGDPANVKRATIRQPAPRFVAAVYNSDGRPASSYELSLVNGNGVLLDEWVQSNTAQEAQGNGAVAAEPNATVVAAATATPAEVATSDPMTTPIAVQPTATAAVTTVTTPTTTGDGTIAIGSTYVVVAGDTIGAIARRAYGDLQLYDELCAYNRLADCNRIEIGDQIQIPNRSELGGTAPLTATATITATTVITIPPASATPTPAVTATPTATITATATVTATTLPLPTPTPAATTGTADGTIMEVIAGHNTLDTVRLMLELLATSAEGDDDIKATLNEAGPYTFFAAVDTAFMTVSEATLERLIDNPAELADFFRAHIVSGAFSTADLTDGMVLETLSGATLTVGVNAGGALTINDVPVIQADIAAANGVVHTVGALLPTPSQ